MTLSFLKGDYRYFWSDSIGELASIPLTWDSSLNTGIGKSSLASLWINSYLNLTVFFTKLGLSWELISLIFWILPAITLSFFSAFFLFRYFFKTRPIYPFLGGLIFFLNTYFLLILTGGQLGVALSYSLAPLVLLRLIKLLRAPRLNNAIIAGLILGLQVLFDPRLAYITFFIFLIYLSFNFSLFIKVVKKSLPVFVLPYAIGILLNSYWILPLILTRTSVIPMGFDSAAGFRFFSFADFSHAFSLLHPNWPENIFGKTYFLQPEFLMLPILAFSSLLFSKNRTIVFFSFIALIGIFLAKGANDPLGNVNKFLFDNLPGMSMFRDPTKWYILVAISYSMLVPFSVASIYKWSKSRQKFQISNLKFQINNKIFNFQNIFLILSIFYLIFLVNPIFRQIKTREVPKEYVQLKDFLVSQPEFFRTLWIPQWQRFGFFSNNHPAIGRGEILKGNRKNQLEQLSKKDTEILLRELSVKYVIVPFDSEGEMFLSDRKYNEKLYIYTVERIEKIEWLKKIQTGKMIVFEVGNPKDHFWSSSADLGIKYTFVRPTEYKVEIKNANKGDVLIFSEGFDKNWIAETPNLTIQSSRSRNGLNSFILSKDGDYTIRVFYKPQELVNTGLIITAMTIVVALGLLGFRRCRRLLSSIL